jgi:hypothetical protein
LIQSNTGVIINPNKEEEQKAMAGIKVATEKES